jgi:acetyl-CoA synthetase
MDVDVVDDDAQPVRGVVGELVCRQPWPSMTRGVWKDDERYLEAYWSTFPGVWRHGDYALADSDGQWFILGRSDDVMNVAGKRLAPAEVEAVLAGHPAVAESAVVGVPDSTKGESVWAFWVPRAGVDDDVSAELRSMVGAALGKPFTPKSVLRVTRLPKTISGKIVRRAVRAAVTGDDPGDLSGMESGDAVDEIRSLVRPDEA